ncbi:MAG: elongation factor G [Sporomusaceae bacterium]|nr:elongation factor G [Sporomusaceae bacterium]
MKEYQREKLRNVGIVAHGGSGKTSLVEACLFQGGVVTRLGRVDDGTATTDFEAEEIKRKITISTGMAPCEWQDNKINFLDAPGYADFVGEVKGVLRAADSVVIPVCAASGVEVETEKSWKYIQAMALPRLFFINKMDRENADYFSVLDECRDKFGNGVVPLQIPIGQEADFSGFIDLIENKAYCYDRKSQGKVKQEVELPTNLSEQTELYRQMLIEAAVENDDDLLNKYLEGEELSVEEIRSAVLAGVTQTKLFPVLCGSALLVMGIDELLNGIIRYLPAPHGVAADPFAAFVFKTTADPFVGRLNYVKVMSGILKQDMAVMNATKQKQEKVGHLFVLRGKNQTPVTQVQAGDIAVIAKMQDCNTGDTLCDKSSCTLFSPIEYPEPMYVMGLEIKKGEEDKVNTALLRLQDEDPTFQIVKDTENRQLLVKGIGEIHLDIMMEKMKRKFGVSASLKLPKIPYRETIRGTVKVEGKHKKQSGGHGQYGHVWLQVEPLPGGDFAFVDAIFGGSVPRQYIPAVEKGVKEALQSGILAGYPLVDVKVTLTDGSYHTVDSSEMAFKTASAMALRKGALQAKPVLLEPVYQIAVTMPQDLMGDVVSHINGKRGRILGMEPMDDGLGKVTAHVPLAELFRFPVDLRSITQGRGVFTQAFSHYDEVPPKVAEGIIASQKTAKVSEEA